MPPKKVASSSAAKAKAKSTSKAKAAPEEDPKARLEKDAEEIFERWQPDGNMDGVIKLAQFADIVRAMNTTKCMLWGHDPVNIIKREWATCGGNVKRELALTDFKTWWPAFVEATDAQAAEKRAAEEAVAAAAAADKATKYGHDGVWKIEFKELNEAMQKARQKGKTPLIIDNTPGQRVGTFFVYSDAYIVECKKMIVEKAKGASVDEILEEERRLFLSANCFQYGRTIVFRLANTACDINGTFNSEHFPAIALMDANEVLNILGVENVGKVKTSPFWGMARTLDERLELESMGANDKFNVIVITQFAEHDYEGFLKDMIPIASMQPIMPQVD